MEGELMADDRFVIIEPDVTAQTVLVDVTGSDAEYTLTKSEALYVARRLLEAIEALS